MPPTKSATDLGPGWNDVNISSQNQRPYRATSRKWLTNWSDQPFEHLEPGDLAEVGVAGEHGGLGLQGASGDEEIG
jgi:hypothetical protein